MHEGLARADAGAGVQLVVDPGRARVPSAVSVRDRRVAFHGDERAIEPGGERDALRRGGAIAGVGLFPFAVENAPHRATEHSRQCDGGVRVRTSVVLRAESATHVILHHADAVERKLERARDVLAHLEDALRAFPDGEVVAGPFRGRAVRFHRRVQRTGRSQFQRDDDVGGGACRIDVAAFQDTRLRPGHIAGGPDERGVRPECGVHRDDVRGGLHLECHECAGALRERWCVRAESRERLARPVNGLIEQGRAGVHHAGHIGRRQCGAYSRQRERRTDVETRHAPAGDGCADEGGVEHRRSHQVGGVPGTARHLFQRVHARYALADDAQRLVLAPRRRLEVR